MKCIPEVGEDQEQMRSEVFCGSIKSFNTRRGFGFVNCEETAQRFGRDVYLSKDEAMVLAVEPAVGLAAARVATTADIDPSKIPPVKEGDFLMFQVKLSTEGFPQAVRVQKIRRLRGVVSKAASSTADGIIVVSGDGNTGAESNSRNVTACTEQLLGADVRLRHAACGQLQLLPNDEVAFCCVNMADSDGQVEALLIDLLHTSRGAGSVLGCFSLKLPRSETEDIGGVTRFIESSITELRGHALTDRILLSDVPSDWTTPDIMRLFSKLGGIDGTATLGKDTDACGFASIAFNTAGSVAKFLSQATHTISENGTTQLAHVGPCPYRKHGSRCCICAPNTLTESGGQDVTLHTDSSTASLASDGSTASMGSASGPLLVADMVYTNSEPLPLPDCAPQLQHFECSPMPSVQIHMTAACPTRPDWRCIHGSIVVSPCAPSMVARSETGYSVCLQWPTVIHASAYVVELLDQGTMTSQRFMRCSPEGVLPPLMDLRVDGLQTCSYAACLRCVAPCGCESIPSPWSVLPLVWAPPSGSMPLAPALHMLPPNAPTIAPAFFPMGPPAPSGPPLFLSSVPASPAALPPIPEDAVAAVGDCEEILTLD